MMNIDGKQAELLRHFFIDYGVKKLEGVFEPSLIMIKNSDLNAADTWKQINIPKTVELSLKEESLLRLVENMEILNPGPHPFVREAFEKYLMARTLTYGPDGR